MGLGERCDEIVRLIDETLAGLIVEPEEVAPDAPASVVPLGPLPTQLAGPDLAAAGF
jgi:hypothetical protein